MKERQKQGTKGEGPANDTERDSLFSSLLIPDSYHPDEIQNALWPCVSLLSTSPGTGQPYSLGLGKRGSLEKDRG